MRAFSISNIMIRPSYLTDSALANFIHAAINEDVGNGDHSTLAAIPAGRVNKAQLIIKSPGILAGVALATRIFHTIDPELIMDIKLHDGAEVEIGNIGLFVEGKAQSILTAERLVLNCMQRMSGIATYAHYLSSLVSTTKARILDTRKTTPNFRMLEKWAVAIGGGTNHRFGLYDMIMLKDNHIDYAGGISLAIKATQEYLKTSGLKLKIEIETRNLNEVQQVLDIGGVDRIMLDNMSIHEMTNAVQLINGKYETEASGGITEETIADVAHTGVDFISVGALTHSVNSLDISLKAVDAL